MGADDNEHRQLKAALKDVSRCLSNVCPTVKEVEYKRLLHYISLPKPLPALNESQMAGILQAWILRLEGVDSLEPKLYILAMSHMLCYKGREDAL
ncbi:hypothetical protein A0H81_08167 [Grifola frondosa]|uniref:Uncharacterized protein n=1 Tax=Grifola frondosa TaxID=5627 RepID=A0A1C7M4P6_GRIFR|nr:hypothetical protein A0H81_08167 [Grifola frondosa]